MLLVIDVGNSNIVLGVFRGKRLVHSWRISTDRGKTEDEYAILIRALFAAHSLKFEDIRDIVISTVVPPLSPVFERLARQYFGSVPLVVGPGVRTGMPIKLDNPREAGADRIVNAVAAFEKYGGPVVVVDFGTATIFDAVSASGEYLGGAIAPGIEISTEALFQRAAMLPRIELVKPPSVIGTNTVNSMQSGIVYGFAGQVDELVTRIVAELGGSAKVVATGELAHLIATEALSIQEVDPLLTLDGLRIIWEKNRGE